MEIQKEITEDEGVFYVEENGQKIAKMNFRFRGNDRFAIEHTEVSPRLKGQGVGTALVDYAVAYARENGMKIIPLCHFAKSVLQSSTSYKDVL